MRRALQWSGTLVLALLMVLLAGLAGAPAAAATIDGSVVTDGPAAKAAVMSVATDEEGGISLKEANVAGINASYTYTGSAIKPKVKVTLQVEEAGSDSGEAGYEDSAAGTTETVTLVEGSDYTVTYKNNKNAGTATVTIKGTGAYCDSITKRFTIKPAGFSKLTFPKIGVKYYTGKAIKPVFTVKYKGHSYKSTNTAAFKVTYSNNVSAGKNGATKTAKVTIEGRGNFKGKKTLYFMIKPRSVSKASAAKISDKTYSGKAKKPAVTLRYNGKKLVKGKDYVVRYERNVKAGRARIVVTGKGNFRGTKTVYFRIVPKAPAVSRVWSTTDAVKLRWSKVKYGTYYDVYRSADGGKTYKKVRTTKGTVCTIHDLKPGKTYRYYVKARYKTSTFNGAGPRSRILLQKTVMVGISKSKLLSLVGSAPDTAGLKTFNTDYKLYSTKKGKALVNYLAELRRSYRVSIIVIDLTTGQGFSCRSNHTMYAASCMKGPFVAFINRDFPNKANNYRRTERRVVVNSSNPDYRSLWAAFDGYSYWRSQMNRMGISSWDGTLCPYIKPRDLGKMWIETYWYFYKATNKNSESVRGLYTHGTMSFLAQGLSGRWTVNAKPGWIRGEGYLALNDAGIVKAKIDGESAPYMVLVMTDAYGQSGKLRKLVRLIDDVHTDMMD